MMPPLAPLGSIAGVALLVLGVLGLIVGYLALRAVGGLIGREAVGWLPHVSRGVVHRAVERLPVEHRERWREEWLADLNVFDDRPMTMLAWSFKIAWSSRRLARELGPGSSRWWMYVTRRLLVVPYAAIRSLTRGGRRLAVFLWSDQGMGLLSVMLLTGGVITRTISGVPPLLASLAFSAQMLAVFLTLGVLGPRMVREMWQRRPR